MFAKLATFSRQFSRFFSGRYSDFFKKLLSILWSSPVSFRTRLSALERGINTAYEVVQQQMVSQSTVTFTPLAGATLPGEYEGFIYRQNYPELAAMSDTDLFNHYICVGKNNGHVANSLRDRLDFIKLVPANDRALEIGPFANPLLRNVVSPENAFYCDVLNQEELQQRARELGVNPTLIPHIHYKLGSGFLDEIKDQFMSIVSSHNIEHQPDLVSHFKQLERRLLAGGRVFLLVPDKRFSFDRTLPTSTIADVLIAHEEKRKTHSLKSLIEHRCLTTHNDSQKHWETREQNHEVIPNAQQLQSALQEWKETGQSYVDVHAWYFTPDSFSLIVQKLNELRLTRLKVVQTYPTRFGSNEFWSVLELDAR